MRTTLGDKPLSSGIKDASVLKNTLEEMVRLEKLKKEEELLSNPRTKMFGLLLKAKRVKEEREK